MGRATDTRARIRYFEGRREDVKSGAFGALEILERLEAAKDAVRRWDPLQILNGY